MINDKPAEIIQWYDAQGDDSWDTVEKVAKWGDEPLIVTEIGWVIKETKKIIIITSQFSNDGDVGNRTKIPMPWIISRKPVEVKNGKHKRRTHRTTDNTDSA